MVYFHCYKYTILASSKFNQKKTLFIVEEEEEEDYVV
jgi:hypothetical protein